MVYGAEAGLFPHITASWFHHVGKIHSFSVENETKIGEWESIFPRKYVNSGTFLGRAKEVSIVSLPFFFTFLLQTKEFLSFLSSETFFAFKVSEIYREEQHLITRYVLQHPELLTIDFSNEIFFSLYHFPLDYFIGFDSNFQLQRSRNERITTAYDLNGFRSHCPAILHGNGLQGKFLYRL